MHCTVFTDVARQAVTRIGIPAFVAIAIAVARHRHTLVDIFAAPLTKVSGRAVAAP